MVDNNSTDDTAQVVDYQLRQVPYPLIYAVEDRQGKCWALNRGLDIARGEIIACLDDDCVPDPGWLAAVTEAFEDPRIALLGGPALSVFSDSVKSDAFREFLANRFLGDFAPFEAVTEIHEKNRPLGMNLSFRREVARAVGGFDLNLGPRPGSHIGREETAFIKSAQSRGYHVFYSPAVVVKHFIEDKRVSRESILRQAFFSGVGVCRERHEDEIRDSVASRLKLSAVFLGEIGYSALRMALLAWNPRRAFVARFRAVAARGKLREVWASRER